nr:hypothetical protein [Tanacetum cinerariifolium]
MYSCIPDTCNWCCCIGNTHIKTESKANGKCLISCLLIYVINQEQWPHIIIYLPGASVNFTYVVASCFKYTSLDMIFQLELQARVRRGTVISLDADSSLGGKSVNSQKEKYVADSKKEVKMVRRCIDQFKTWLHPSSSKSIDIAPADAPIRTLPLMKSERYMLRPQLPGSLDEVKDLKTSDPHGVSGCCKTKKNLSGMNEWGKKKEKYVADSKKEVEMVRRCIDLFKTWLHSCSSRSIDIAPADAPIRTLPLMKSEMIKVCQDEKVIEEENDEDFLFFTFAASPVANHNVVGNLRYMMRPQLPGSLDEVKDLKTSDPHGVSGCCKTKQNLSGMNEWGKKHV